MGFFALCPTAMVKPKRRETQANEALALILSFLPRDAIELALAGQAVLFNELLADGARDVLGGMPGAMKPRSHAGLVNMGRLVQGHLDRLEKRGNQPARTDVDVTRTEPVVRPAVDEHPLPVTSPPNAEIETWPMAGVPGRKADTMDVREASVEISWLDAPFEQWVIEMSAHPPAFTNPTSTAPDIRGNSENKTSFPGNSHDTEPAIPRRSAGYFPGRTFMHADTAAGD
jgi:hypothetical protein